MAGERDEIEGRLKQAAGDLTGDNELKREGERDELAGKAKDAAQEVQESTEDAIDSIKDSLT